MYCILCGTRNPEYAAFCYKCGTKLVNNNSEQSAKPTNLSSEAAVETSQSAGDSNRVIKAEDLADKPRPEPTVNPTQSPASGSYPYSQPTPPMANQAAAPTNPAANNHPPLAANPFVGPPASNPTQPPAANPFATSPNNLPANANNRPMPPSNPYNQPLPNNYPYPVGPNSQPPANNQTGPFPPVNYPPNANNQFGRPPTGAFPIVPPSQPPANNPSGQFWPTNNPTGPLPNAGQNQTGPIAPVNKPSEPISVPNNQTAVNNPAGAVPPAKNTANPYAQVPPTPPANPSQNWPGANPNPAPGAFPPPTNPYGAYNFAPPVPPRTAIAPNGLPYSVVDNPNRFFKYKNKEGKQVYAAFAEPMMRIIAAIIDTFVVFVPFLFVLIFYMASLGQATIEKINNASNNGDASVLNQYFPHWLTLVVAVAYLAYCTILTAANGQTIGKRLTRIKVMTLDGNKPDFRVSLLRNLFGFGLVLGNYIAFYNNALADILGQVLSAGVAMGFLFIIFDAKRQGWHDKLAGTLVVRSKQLVEGVDFPAKG